MSNKRFELVPVNELPSEMQQSGKKGFNGQFRLRALKDFTCFDGEDSIAVKKGDFGGFVSGEHNLSQTGCGWVFEHSCLLGDAFLDTFSVIKNNSVVLGNVNILAGSCIDNTMIINDRKELIRLSHYQDVHLLKDVYIWLTDTDFRISNILNINFNSLEAKNQDGTISPFAIMKDGFRIDFSVNKERNIAISCHKNITGVMNEIRANS